MSNERRTQISLFALRLGVFMVMLFWTLDKFVNPKHSSAVFAGFYGIKGLDEAAFIVIGVAEMILIVAFVLGIAKRWTYGLVLLLHGISTLSSLPKYMEPFSNLLFFAAWPMLAACLALYLLREQDDFMTLSHFRRTTV